MSQNAEKQLAAAAAVKYVASGMLVGLGSGSTSAMAVRLLGERVQREGLKITGVPTSSATRALAIEVGIPLLEDLSNFQLDLAFDGADEATRDGWLIKGGGGAHLRERIIAAAAKRFLVMVDSTKVVDRLGQFPLPVEVFRLGWRNVERILRSRDAEVKLREREGKPFITDEGNYILDCRFPAADYAKADELASFLRSVAGVVDHGLFLGMTSTLIIASGSEVEEVRLR
jgi:ribose 5-phosphate isomerase A